MATIIGLAMLAIPPVVMLGLAIYAGIEHGDWVGVWIAGGFIWVIAAALLLILGGQ